MSWAELLTVALLFTNAVLLWRNRPQPKLERSVFMRELAVEFVASDRAIGGNVSPRPSQIARMTREMWDAIEAESAK